MKDKLTYQPCKCPNQHLLEDGEICKICMGKIEFQNPYIWPNWGEFVAAYLWNGIEEKIPIQVKRMYETDPFDELYFEELENYYDNINYAA